jgi:hypothetical protein
MSPDEQRIMNFLRTEKAFLSIRQISLAIADPARDPNPTWAQPSLIHLTKLGVLEMNPQGEFRLKPGPV